MQTFLLFILGLTLSLRMVFRCRNKTNPFELKKKHFWNHVENTQCVLELKNRKHGIKKTVLTYFCLTYIYKLELSRAM